MLQNLSSFSLFEAGLLRGGCSRRDTAPRMVLCFDLVRRHSRWTFHMYVAQFI